VRRVAGILLLLTGAGLLVAEILLAPSGPPREIRSSPTPSPMTGPASPAPDAPLGPPASADTRVTTDHRAGSYARHDGEVDATMRRCSTGRQEQNEPTVAVNPRDLDVVVAGANDYCAGIVNGDAWAGYYRSTDGGATWSSSLVPGYPADGSDAGRASPAHGSCDGAGDPTQAFDTEGRLFYGFICADYPNDPSATPAEQEQDAAISTFVATYDDDGDRYARTVLLARGRRGRAHDKINVAVDQTSSSHAGNVYAAWVRISSGRADEFVRGTILFSRSTDQGRTFSDPMAISDLRVAVFPDIAVGPDGAVYVTYRVGITLRITKSTDGGATFSGPRIVSSLAPFDSDRFSGDGSRECGDGPFTCPGRFTFSRFQTQAAVAADETGVHVAWNERRGEGQSRVLVRTSPDGLIWFDQPVTVDEWPTGHQYFPDIASADGVITVVFYDSRNDSGYHPERPPGNTRTGRNSGGAVDAVVARSTDGGTTWSETRVSMRSSNFGFESPFQVPFWGDYIYISAVPGAVQVAWTDSRDLVPGRDPLEPAGQGDRDGFDVFDPCVYVPTDILAESFDRPSSEDPCLTRGGYDQNVYSARV
jgi:hypothetical protein